MSVMPCLTFNLRSVSGPSATAQSRLQKAFQSSLTLQVSPMIQMLFLLFKSWFAVSVRVLSMMDMLICHLHTLLLHFVGFQVNFTTLVQFAPCITKAMLTAPLNVSLSFMSARVLQNQLRPWCTTSLLCYKNLAHTSARDLPIICCGLRKTAWCSTCT